MTVDLTVLTALIEARPLCATAAVTDALGDAVGPARVWPPEAFFEAKCEEQRRRHARFGDTSDNLEPNLKDGPGGLRDLHQLGWLALRSFGVHTLDRLIALNLCCLPCNRRKRRQLLNGRYETISTLRYRLDVTRSIGIVAEGLPEFFDCCTKTLLEIYKRIGRPKLMAKLIPAYQLAGMVK